MALIDDMAASLRNVTQELAIEISARYTGSQLRYPTEARRYERDMQEVYVARRLLEEYEAVKAHTSESIDDVLASLRQPGRLEELVEPKTELQKMIAELRTTFFD